MDSNLDKIALDLYGKIATRFPNITFGDENGKVLSKRQDIPKGRFFEFEYEENGEPLGTITITLDADDGIVIEVSGDLVNDDDHTTHHNAYKFIRSFRQFAKNRLLGFDVQNIGKSNLDKRDYEFRAAPKEQPTMEPMMENKLYGTNKISYQDLGEARLVIKHSQPVNVNLAAGRTMHIENIYIENAVGERFRYPVKHINGARALAEHIKVGGTPYDGIGKYITSLSEELAQLRKFKGYVSRHEALSEAMGDITSKVMERIESIKKEVQHLQRPTFYSQFAEAFEEKEEQAIPETIMNDWIDRLTIRTFNEELKSVFPYIYNIVDESDIPVVELGVEDILGEAGDGEDDDANFERGYNETYSPEDEFESFVEEIVREDKDEVFSPNKDAQHSAIEKLNRILEKELKGGPEGINAINSLKGLVDDPEFLLSLQDIDPDLDIRPLLQQYILDRDPNVASQIHFGGEEGGAEEPEAPPMPAPEAPPMPAPEAGAVPPEAGAVPPGPEAGAVPPMPPGPEAGAVPPAPIAESEDDVPWDVDPKEKKSKLTTPGKHGQGYSQARHLARQGLQKAIAAAKKSGATLDTKLDFGHKEMTLHDAIKECGMTAAECGFDAEPEQSANPLYDMLDFVSGFYNKDSGNFPLGGERIKIKVEKEFEDGRFGNASPEDLTKILAFIDKKDQAKHQHDIMRLAGLRSNDSPIDEDPGEQQLDQLNKLMAQFNDVKHSKTSSGSINGQPASYDDAMNKFKNIKMKFGDDEIDFSNPEQAGEKMKGMMGGMMKGMQGQVPNQNIQFPGGQMNPQDMMKQIMQKINFGN